MLGWRHSLEAARHHGHRAFGGMQNVFIIIGVQYMTWSKLANYIEIHQGIDICILSGGPTTPEPPPQSLKPALQRLQHRG